MDNYFIDDFKQKKERYYASLSLLKKSMESLDNAQNLYNRLTEEVEELKPEDEQPANTVAAEPPVRNSESH